MRMPRSSSSPAKEAWDSIETTDRVTRTANLTGLASGNSTPGVGFHKGVRFNLKAIIP